MGLDQYLYARQCVSGTNHKRVNGEYVTEDVPAYGAVLEAVGLDKNEVADEFPALTVEVKVAQWRKAWAIHRWLVNEIQDGKDDCRDYYASRDTLIDLRNLCQQALDNPEDANMLLPDEYFGDGDTEWHTYQLTHTITQLDKVLNNSKFDGWDFQYSSSW